MKSIALAIKQQLGRLCSVVESMLALSGMMRSSFGTAYNRCGKPTCWCADRAKKGHEFTRLMWTDETGVKSRSVRDDDIQAVQEAVQQYHQFKQLRREFRIEEEKLGELLDDFERETTVKTRSKLGYT